VFDEIPEYIKELASKRRVFRSPDGFSLSYVSLTPEEEERLFEFAKGQGLLTRYEFSGIPAYGVSRNNAAHRLLEGTRQKAFELLRRVFGSSAHFRSQPSNLSVADFYWRKARLALLITGPNLDDRTRAEPTRSRDPSPKLYEEFNSSPEKPKLITVPYYLVWHQPARFLDQIRQELVASGQYPRLVAK
jgi:hypothetical protein